MHSSATYSARSHCPVLVCCSITVVTILVAGVALLQISALLARMVRRPNHENFQSRHSGCEFDRFMYPCCSCLTSGCTGCEGQRSVSYQ